MKTEELKEETEIEKSLFEAEYNRGRQEAQKFFKDAVNNLVPFAELSPERWEELKQELLKVLGEKNGTK